MPRLTVRLSPEDLARLRAAAELRGVPTSELLRWGACHAVEVVLGEAVAAPPRPAPVPGADRRRDHDRRTPRERYGDEEVAEWTGHLAEHGERRRTGWPERRGVEV